MTSIYYFPAIYSHSISWTKDVNSKMPGEKNQWNGTLDLNLNHKKDVISSQKVTQNMLKIHKLGNIKIKILLINNTL